MKQTIKAHVAIVTQIAIVGLSYLFVKEGLTYADPFTQLSHRFIVATLGIWIVRYFVPHQSIFTRQAFKELLPLGLFYPVLFFSLQTLALTMITTLEAGIISATIPILILVLAMVILKEKPSRLQKIVMVIAFLGVLYLNLNGQSQQSEFSFLGTTLMFLSALSSALYTITAKKVALNYETIDMTTFMLTFGMSIFTVIAICQRVLGRQTVSYFEPLFHTQYWIAILYLGLLSSLGSAFLSNYAIHHVPASTMGLFSNLSPIITVFAGVFIAGEAIKLYQIIGIAIILIPIIGMNLIQPKLSKK